MANGTTAGESNINMLSGMEPLLSLSGDEFVEVVKRMPDGSFKNFRVNASKLRTGKSVYDVAVDGGFVGTEAEFLVTLIGDSAYEIAVRHGVFTGTEAEWVAGIAPLYSHDPLDHNKFLVANEAGVAEWVVFDRSLIGLDKVDNTPDLEKPVSQPTQVELNKRVLRTQMTTEVMSVLLSLEGVRLTDDRSDIIFDEGVVEAS
jgi:hypothetical protein